MNGRFAVGVSLLCLVGCSAPPPVAPPGSAGPAATVEVVVRDLVPVLTVDASTVPITELELSAPASGVVALDSGGERGAVQSGEVLGRIGSTSLRSPVAGSGATWLVPAGRQVPAGFPVVRLSVQVFAVSGRVPVDDAYRVLMGDATAKAQVIGGPGPFNCTLVPGPTAGAASTDGVDGGGPEVRCLAPSSVRLVAGLPAVLALSSGARPKAVVVPVTAVAGRSDTGRVTRVRAGGALETVEVQLGATDGVDVEVTSGLRAGERILATAPNLRLGPVGS